MAKKNGNGNGHNGRLKLYKSYMFRTKDPVIDELRGIAQDRYGKLNQKAFRDIHANGGPTPGCLQAWFGGDTLRPNSCSTEAAGRAMGKKRVWVNHTVK
jgi:hypothetical protein